jgi:acyl-CoA reductase-like NAD-dependent aldehyde dehydrogenase
MNIHPLIIAGKPVETGISMVVRNPYDGSTAAEVCSASPPHLQDALAAADRAFDSTRKLSSCERSVILGKIASEITSRSEEFARAISLEAGKPIRDARVEVSRAVNTFVIASEEAKRFGGEIMPLDTLPSTKGRWGFTRRFPVGPVFAISPFNFPLNLVAHKAAPAIAVGNPLILKPASFTPVTALKLGEVILESGWPKESLSVVPCKGSIAETIITDARLKKLSFTGSAEVGWRLKSLNPRLKVTLELGGNAACVIDDESNLDYAAARCIAGAFSYAGQVCISIQRIIIREDLYDRFVSAFIEKTRALKLGDPLDETTDIGPMIDTASVEKAKYYVDSALSAGANMLFGGEIHGTMFPPTILENVPRSQPASCSEIFAPVAVLSKFKNFDEALEEVNDSTFGLQAGIFTRDLKNAWKAFETIETGGVIIGDVPTFRIDQMPYGGVKESGFGREGVRYAMEEMTELRLMTINPV